MLPFETALTHSFYFEKERLLYIRIKPEPEPTLELIKLNFRQTKDILGERKVIVIMDIRHLDFADFPKDVMEYMADNEYNEKQEAIAVLIRGLGQKLIANFYLKAVRPKVKTKIFNTLEGAIEWHEIMEGKDLGETIEKTIASR